MRTFGELEYRNGVWRMHATPPVIIKAKRLFPRAEKTKTGHITMKDTPEVSRDLDWFMDRYPLELDERSLAQLFRQAEKHRGKETTLQEILKGRLHRDFPRQAARESRDYQEIAATMAAESGGMLLADDLGAGKTQSLLLTLLDPEKLPALVVLPTHLVKQWERETRAVLPWLLTHVVRTRAVYDPKDHRELSGTDPDVLFITYSKLAAWADYLTGKVKTVLFDEVQEMRLPGSQKYVAGQMIAETADLVVGATNTPVYNYGDEIYHVITLLHPDALGEFDEFIREWCGGGLKSGKHLVEDPRALGIYLREEGLMLRRTKADIGRELPPVIRIPHNVDVDQAVLDRLTANAVDLADVILSTEARARGDAFQAGRDLNWQMRNATGVAKAPYVAAFVKMILESEQKVILFGWHRAVYEIWMDALAEYNPLMYTGSESSVRKEKNKDLFIRSESWMRKPPRILILSLRSGIGLDGLQHAGVTTGVFGELDWSPTVHNQCIGRYWRDGQPEGCTAYFLVSDYGSDPVVAEVLDIKRMQSEPMIDPDAPLIETVADTRDRVKRLAVAVKQQRTGRHLVRVPR